MKADAKKHLTIKAPAAALKVTFGAVTVSVIEPPERVKKANIKAGQAALKRGKSAFVTAGVKIAHKKTTPLFSGCDDRPGFLVRELNGKKTVGQFVSGVFRPERTSVAKTAKKQSARA